MTRLAASRFAAFAALALGLVLGLAACGVISTLVEGWKYAKAVEADLESATEGQTVGRVQMGKWASVDGHSRVSSAL
jgi:hypothetical protein